MNDQAVAVYKYIGIKGLIKKAQKKAGKDSISIECVLRPGLVGKEECVFVLKIQGQDEIDLTDLDVVHGLVKGFMLALDFK